MSDNIELQLFQEDGFTMARDPSGNVYKLSDVMRYNYPDQRFNDKTGAPITNTIRDQYRIGGLLPEIADEKLEKDFADPYEGIFRKKGDFKYSEDDLKRLTDIEMGDNKITTNMYEMRVRSGDDPMVAMSRAQLAGFAPVLGSAVAYENLKNATKSRIDNYERGNILGSIKDLGSMGLSVLDMVGVNAPIYGPLKRGSTSLLDFAINAIRRKR
jgi:hypothetical protein